MVIGAALKFGVNRVDNEQVIALRLWFRRAHDALTYLQSLGSGKPHGTSARSIYNPKDFYKQAKNLRSALAILDNLPPSHYKKVIRENLLKVVNTLIQGAVWVNSGEIDAFNMSQTLGGAAGFIQQTQKLLNDIRDGSGW